MMKPICFSLSFAFILFSTSLWSQEQLGLRLGNYAGINGTLLNPANHLTSPFRWDVNLIELGVFFDNNYAFIENRSNLDFLRYSADIQFESRTDITDENPVDGNTFIIDFNTDNRRRYAQMLTTAVGPSFFVRLNEKHTLGLVTRARVMTNAFDVGNELSYYTYENRPFGSSFTLEPLQANMLSWSEIGLNYLYQMPLSNGNLGLGFTLKFLQGYETAYFQSNKAITFTKENAESIGVSEVDVEHGFTTTNLEGDEFKPRSNGKGIGLDLGAVLTLGSNENDYDWKLGLALLDLGRIDFQNAEKHQLTQLNPTVIFGEDYEDYNLLEDLSPLAREFSRQVLNDSLASFQGNELSVWLPAAISLQVDRRIVPSVFLNFMLVQGLHFKAIANERGSLAALTPRYEHRWFEAALPVSLYEWQHLRVGMAVRLGFLHLGTENLSSWFGSKEYYGSDFYIAFKINPFHLPWFNKGKDSPKKLRPSKSKVKCYQF